MSVQSNQCSVIMITGGHFSPYHTVLTHTLPHELHYNVIEEESACIILLKTSMPNLSTFMSQTHEYN